MIRIKELYLIQRNAGDDVLEKPYSEQESKSFQNEESYRGLDNYEEEYNKQLHKKLDKEKESIEDI